MIADLVKVAALSHSAFAVEGGGYVILELLPATAREVGRGDTKGTHIQMPYTLALFIHVVGVVTLFVALGVEIITNIARRRSRTTEQVIAISNIGNINRFLHPIALLLILLGGVSMAATAHLFSQAWVALALIVTLLMPILGTTIHAPRNARILKLATANDSRRLSPELRRRINDPVLSTWNIVAPVLGVWILYLMTTKPQWAAGLIAFAVALVVGFALSIPLWRGEADPTKSAEAATSPQ